ncbi:MAG: AAA family ATPase [Candidatus Helarchaeota archaeon]
MKRYCLIGVKGIGKTTLIKSILPLPNIECYIGSQILRVLVGQNFNQFDYFSEERKEFFRKAAIQFLWDRQEQTRKNILIDGHVTLYNPKIGDIEAIFTQLDCEFYTDLILIDASVDLVLERRKRDSKKRILERDLILQELEAERTEANRLKEQYGMKIHYILDDGTENTRNKLIAILSGSEL